MAGMTAAACAALGGATVIVIEKAPDLGGSAVLAHWIWTAANFEELLDRDPAGDVVRRRILVEEYSAGIDFVRSLDVTMTPGTTLDAVMGFRTVAHLTDMEEYIRRCRLIVEGRGGWVVTGTNVRRLLTSGTRVAGVEIAREGERAIIEAPWTLLATGGFQGDASVRRRLIGEHAEGLLVRSNPCSTGDGLRLAEAVGGAVSPWTGTFYGHLMAAPLARALRPSDFSPLTQLYCTRAVLLDLNGTRFVDESEGYYRSASAVALQPQRRALLVGDERIRQDDRAMLGPHRQFPDRLGDAAREGAHVAVAADLADLDRDVSAWGYSNVAAAIVKFGQDVTAPPATITPTRRFHRRPLESPFFAVEVEAAITFPFRGIAVDADGRVHDQSGGVIDGLMAAGADAGGLFGSTYGGGLAMSLVFGRRAARAALSTCPKRRLLAE
jgi:succinate dehydrogenase/fumarate reductase flavoprotein subunit